MLTYERFKMMSDIEEVVENNLCEGEFVIKREPFRWTKDGEVINNAYESFSLLAVCVDNGWEPIHDFNHIAVVRKAGESCD